MNAGSFLFLGCGSSWGVPIIACRCGVCLSNDPRNKRLRSSGLVQVAGKTLLIDAGPDFRQQALRYGIQRVDGLLLTHPHYDHIGGLDDLRIYSARQKGPIPCLASSYTCADVKRRYDYLFAQKSATFTLRLELEPLKELKGSQEFVGIHVAHTSYLQTRMPVTGFRIGSLAYITDIKEYPESIFDDLKGVRFLVLSALKPESGHLHLSIDEAVEFARKVGAARTYLTHMGHEVDYEAVSAGLPSNVALGYDGLRFEFDDERAGG